MGRRRLHRTHVVTIPMVVGDHKVRRVIAHHMIVALWMIYMVVTVVLLSMRTGTHVILKSVMAVTDTMIAMMLLLLRQRRR